MPVDVLVPPLGTTVDTLTLIAWYRREGEWVEKDEPLFAVETDKATLDIEAPASGILRRIEAAEGDAVTTLTRIAVIALPGESAETAEERRTAGVDEWKSGIVVDLAGTSALPLLHSSTPPPVTSTGRKFISPRARRLAEAHGIEWRAIPGTGPDGAVVERDVRGAARERLE
jgi:pyruvate/2-oxoglutarate dehydrogenase complex dihydrolipoamide acyltransferase (E2) component